VADALVRRKISIRRKLSNTLGKQNNKIKHKEASTSKTKAETYETKLNQATNMRQKQTKAKPKQQTNKNRRRMQTKDDI
jgi:hypothetical protein